MTFKPAEKWAFFLLHGPNKGIKALSKARGLRPWPLETKPKDAILSHFKAIIL
jgi:hypothetical protein